MLNLKRICPCKFSYPRVNDKIECQGHPDRHHLPCRTWNWYFIYAVFFKEASVKVGFFPPLLRIDFQPTRQQRQLRCAAVVCASGGRLLHRRRGCTGACRRRGAGGGWGGSCYGNLRCPGAAQGLLAGLEMAAFSWRFGSEKRWCLQLNTHEYI